MQKIIYKFLDGTTSIVAVSDEFYAIYEELEKADKLSDRKQARRSQSLECSMDHGWDIADKDMDIVSILTESETQAQLYTALSLLSPEQQVLIKQVIFDGVSQADIAARQNVSRYAINKRVARILRKLKKIMS